NTSITGYLLIDNSGLLDVNGKTVTVTGDLIVGSANFGGGATGTLRMQDAAAVLTVNGNATLHGSDENGQLTAGVLNVRGNFAQSGAYVSAASFAASGTHKVVLNGNAAQSVSMDSAGIGTGNSHFQKLEIGNTSGAVSFSTS